MNKITDLLPTRETFVWNITLGEETIVKLKYKQATIGETMVFYETKDRESYLFQFIKENGEISKEFDKKEERKLIVLMNFNKIIDILASTMHKRRKSPFPPSKEGRRGTQGSNMIEVCGKFNVSLLELQKNYTFEQYDRMSEQISFYYNEQSEEGRKKNDKLFNTLTEEEKKALLARIRKSKNAKVVKTELVSRSKF